MVEDNITKIILNWNFYFLRPFLYVYFWYSEIIQSVLFCFAQECAPRSPFGLDTGRRVPSASMFRYVQSASVRPLFSGPRPFLNAKKHRINRCSLEREKGVIRSESRARARSSLTARARHRASSPVRVHVSLRSVRVRSAPLLGSSSLSECKKAPNKSVLFRAGKGTRTLDPDLGKVVLYQLSYSREDTAIIDKKNKTVKV